MNNGFELPDFGSDQTSFSLMARKTAALNSIEVLLDEVSLGVFTPEDSQVFIKFTTEPTKVKASPCLLKFQGSVSGADAPATFIDDIGIRVD